MKTRSTLAALGLLLSLGGCATAGLDTPEEPAGLADRASGIAHAQSALNEQRYRDAKAAFSQILQGNPVDAEARVGVAEADLGLGAAGPAREAFASLAANEPVRTRALQGLGLANLRLGDRDAALAALESATEADPKLWRAWVGLARLHDGKGEWDLATKAYDQALATAPDRGLVLNNRGVSMLARGEPAEAAKQFEQALQVRPDLATAKANLRLALAMAGHDGDILAAAGTEELPQVLNNLGFIAMVQGDLPRAESYFYRAIEASPTFYQRAYDNLQRLDQLRERDTSHVVL